MSDFINATSKKKNNVYAKTRDVLVKICLIQSTKVGDKKHQTTPKRVARVTQLKFIKLHKRKVKLINNFPRHLINSCDGPLNCIKLPNSRLLQTSERRRSVLHRIQEFKFLVHSSQQQQTTRSRYACMRYANIPVPRLSPRTYCSTPPFPSSAQTRRGIYNKDCSVKRAKLLCRSVRHRTSVLARVIYCTRCMGFAPRA